MKPIYDLSQKFAGLAAFCGTDVFESGVADELFRYKMDEKSSNEAFSKLKAASRNLSDDDRIRLSAHVNGLIAKVTRRNDLGPARGPIRPEDWDRPITDFFTELENHCGEFSPQLDVNRRANGTPDRRRKGTPLRHDDTIKPGARFALVVA